MNLLFQIDGKLPNFALMRLSTYLKSRGEKVEFSNSVNDLWFMEPQTVYCSSIFTTSEEKRKVLREKFPEAIVGGDGYFPVWNDLTIIRPKSNKEGMGSNLRQVIKDQNPEELRPDYSLYPKFTGSLGYSQRGCRLDCGFCRMKTREGEARSVATLHSIWRGEPYPKHVHLLDNDFFGQPEWRDKLEEAIKYEFKVCFNQGINIRLVNEEQAHVLARVWYADDSFTAKRLYTAWDNLGDERVFKTGVATLAAAGISPKHLFVYMLIGFRRGETEEEILYRFNEMVGLGCRPYPMVFNNANAELKKFQRWAIRRYYEFIPWEKYKAGAENEVAATEPKPEQLELEK